MADQLFKKAMVFTDIHFGKSNNSKHHNEDCVEFVKWAIEEGKTFGAETFIFCGDWHHNRNNIHIQTMNYSLQALELLSKNFKNIFFIPGNHDQFFKDRRDLTSVEWARNINNITIINDFLNVDDVTFCPWLVADDKERLATFKSRYMFGHFELPHFYMNKMIKMPEHDHMVSLDDLNKQEYVFSGHFHKRQMDKNVIYIGNAFPHNFSDVSEEKERGIMLLEWGHEPKFKAWDKSPKYKIYTLSEIITNPEKYLDDTVYAKITADVELSFEEFSYIKEQFITDFNPRKLEIVKLTNSIAEQEFNEEIVFQSLDQIVIEGLNSFESDNIKSEKLVQIYMDLYL